MGVYDAQIEDTLKKRGDCCILFVWMFCETTLRMNSLVILPLARKRHSRPGSHEGWETLAPLGPSFWRLLNFNVGSWKTMGRLRSRSQEI